MAPGLEIPDSSVFTFPINPGAGKRLIPKSVGLCVAMEARRCRLFVDLLEKFEDFPLEPLPGPRFSGGFICDEGWTGSLIQGAGNDHAALLFAA